MGRNSKTHKIDNLEARYIISKRKWSLKEGNKEMYFNNVIEMVKAYPKLEEIKYITYLLRAKKYEKESSTKAWQPQLKLPGEILEKEVDCYYCSGRGKDDFGIKCKNCNGSGKIILTARKY